MARSQIASTYQLGLSQTLPSFVRSVRLTCIDGIDGCEKDEQSLQREGFVDTV